MGTCFRYPDVGIYKHQKLFFTSLTQALYKMETAAVLGGGGIGCPNCRYINYRTIPGFRF